MKNFIFLFISILIYSSVFSQNIKGKVTDKNGEAISKVNIIFGDKGCITNKRGKFNAKIPEGINSITFQHINFKSKTVNISYLKQQKTNIILEENINMLNDIEIKREKKESLITDVLSINVIKKEMFEEENNTDLSDIIQRFSGITLTDKQISIRGGSGWNAMAGSRVLILIDDIPLLSGDMGQIPWDLIPIENIEQIEVIKGASSAIYGSAAMNGVINVTTKAASRKLINKHPFLGYTQINTTFGIYDSPNNKKLKWWTGKRYFYKTDILHSEFIGNTSFTLGVNYFKDEGYRYLEENNRKQISLNLMHHSTRIKGLRYGINGTLMKQNVGNFLLWESYEQALIPIDSNLYQTNSLLFHIDPNLTYQLNNGKHIFKSRYMKIKLDNNTNGLETGKDLFSETYYLDYKYKGYSNLLSSNIIIGTTRSSVFSKAEVFNGGNSSNINSFYSLIEKENKGTTVSFGGRYEFVQIKSEESFSVEEGEETNNFSIGYPLFYAGIKHTINHKSSFRSYFGQGVRFPTIAEMAISTNVHGGTYIYPNLNLKAESGWSYEMAYHLNEEINNLKFDVDIAYFMMQYNNMMEFSFAQWGSEYDLVHAYGLGFKTVNIGKTQIEGIETELNAKLKINQNWKSNLSIGYTYMRPISLTPDSVYAQTNHSGIIEPITFNNSSSDTTILKYRYQHILKVNTGLQYKNTQASMRIQYNDYMRNIDEIFTSQLVNNGVPEANFPAIIPGINDSRENNKNGDIVIDLNIGITINKFSKINFIINNATNAEIITRPTDMQSPRTYSIKLKLNI